MQRTDPAELHVCRGADVPAMGWLAAVDFEAAKIKPVRNRWALNGRPEGGIAVSPLVNDPREAPETTWSQWVTEETPGTRDPDRDGRVQVVTLADDARVLVIDSYADLLATAAAFPPPPGLLEADLGVDATQDPGASLVAAFLSRTADQGFDYEAMSTRFDALWVTPAALAETRHSEPSLNTWDVETVLLLGPGAVGPATT